MAEKLMEEELRPFVEAQFPLAGNRIFDEIKKIAEGTPEFREFILEQLEEGKKIAEKLGKN